MPTCLDDLIRAFHARCFASRYDPAIHSNDLIPRRQEFAAGVEPAAGGILQFAQAEHRGHFWELYGGGLTGINFPGYRALGPSGMLLLVASPQIPVAEEIDSIFAWSRPLAFRGAALLFDPFGVADSRLSLMFRLPGEADVRQYAGYVAVSVSDSGNVTAESRVPEVDGWKFLPDFANRAADAPHYMGSGILVTGDERSFSSADEALDRPGAEDELATHLPEVGQFYADLATRWLWLRVDEIPCCGSEWVRSKVRFRGRQHQLMRSEADLGSSWR